MKNTQYKSVYMLYTIKIIFNIASNVYFMCIYPEGLGGVRGAIQIYSIYTINRSGRPVLRNLIIDQIYKIYTINRENTRYKAADGRQSLILTIPSCYPALIREKKFEIEYRYYKEEK